MNCFNYHHKERFDYSDSLSVWWMISKCIWLRRRKTSLWWGGGGGRASGPHPPKKIAFASKQFVYYMMFVFYPIKKNHTVPPPPHFVNPGAATAARDVRVQILIWFQTFCSSQNPIFRLEWIEEHIFSGISDYFRLFLGGLFRIDALTPLCSSCTES